MQTARKNFYDVFFGMNELLEVVNKHILITNGEIYEIKIENRDRQTVAVKAESKMEITNNSEISITLINPKYFEQSEVKFFAVTKEDCSLRYGNIYSSPYPKNLSANKNFPELVKNLKENKTPENLLIRLEPKEKFIWDEEIYFEFHTADTKRIWQGVGWKEFRNKGDLFWLRFEYRLPEELSAWKLKLFEIFPDCWKDDGEIPMARYQIEDISGKKMSVETAPVLIDFTLAKAKETK